MLHWIFLFKKFDFDSNYFKYIRFATKTFVEKEKHKIIKVAYGKRPHQKYQPSNNCHQKNFPFKWIFDKHLTVYKVFCFIIYGNNMFYLKYILFIQTVLSPHKYIQSS